jgi:hypothetical protein
VTEIPSREPKETLLQTMHKYAPRARRITAGLLLIALGLLPLIQDPRQKATLLSVFALTLVFCLYEERKRVYELLNTILLYVRYPNPPLFENFDYAAQDIRMEISKVIERGIPVRIDVITVGGSQSWPLVNNAMRKALAAPTPTAKFLVRFGSVEAGHLRSWDQEQFACRSEQTAHDISLFRNRNDHHFKSGTVALSHYLYDNIPHWHGMLINGSILYLGRTEWEFQPDGSAVGEMLVGQIEYRKYTKGDNYGGDERIARFENWVERYQLRFKERFQAQQPASPGK